jgi:hypothetical protein
MATYFPIATYSESSVTFRLIPHQVEDEGPHPPFPHLDATHPMDEEQLVEVHLQQRRPCQQLVLRFQAVDL